MAYKKTNEAWFGDSFNRDSVVTACSYDLAKSGDSLTGVIGYVTDAGATYGIAAKGAIDVNSSNVTYENVVSSVTDNLTTKLKEIQAQIDDLKQNYVPKKGADKLRSALKTLSYTREI